MLIGPLNARFATDMQMGSLMAEAIQSTSHMKASPAEAVAVATLPPAAEAPMQSDIALCSDSAQTYSVLTSPLATNSAKFYTIMVCGVIG